MLDSSSEDFNICLLVRYGAQNNGRANHLITPPNFIDHFDTTLDLPRNIKGESIFQILFFKLKIVYWWSFSPDKCMLVKLLLFRNEQRFERIEG